MKKYNKVTPEGTKDILFEECRTQREAERRLGKVFLRRGYNEVLTPGLEYYDVFNLRDADIPQHEMYKTVDNNGRLIVFRPDSTLPIARMTATRLQSVSHPIRLYYNQSVYRNRPDLSGRSNESPQMGIELMGAAGLRADLEVFSTAIEALSSCIDDFRIEIGHGALFKAFADKLNAPDNIIEEIRACIESKNYALLEELLDEMEQTEEVEAIRALPRLFGGSEALEKAEQYCTYDDTREMLEYTKKLFHALSQFGLGNRIMVDLGLVQRNNYYTGTVFSAYVEGSGDAVLVGGRYDNLLGKFDSPMPAVGFSIDTDKLCNIMIHKDRVPLKNKAKIIIHAVNGYEIKAQRIANSYENDDFICETSVFENIEQTKEYARQNGFTKLIIANESNEEISL